MGIFDELAGGLRLPLRGETTAGFRAAQLGAVHAICGHFWDKTRPALVVMPTGSGKSAVMMASSVLLRSSLAPYLMGHPGRIPHIGYDFRRTFFEW